MDPRGFPTSLPEFQKVFPDDAACAKYLESLRWPDGFICPDCGHKAQPYRFPSRSSVVLRCRKCKVNTSLTASTVMRQTHTPLSIWFWGAYLVTTQTPGQSALQFQRQLGLSRYETAFQILHKLRAGMVRPERDCIGAEHLVEVDECLVGGRTRGEGAGVHHMVTVAGAVEVRARKDAEARAAKHRQEHEGGVPLKKLVYAGRLRLRVVPERSTEQLVSFVMENVAPGARVRTDAYRGYLGLSALGYAHDRMVIAGDVTKAETHLPMIHLERVLKMPSCSCQAADHNSNHANPYHRLTVIQANFIISAQAPRLKQPAERAFYYPSSRQDFETFNIVATADNLQSQFAEGTQLLHPVNQGSEITAVGPDDLQSAIQAHQRLDQWPSRIAILYASRSNHHCQNQAQTVHRHMTFAPRIFLPAS